MPTRPSLRDGEEYLQKSERNLRVDTCAHTHEWSHSPVFTYVCLYQQVGGALGKPVYHRETSGD